MEWKRKKFKPKMIEIISKRALNERFFSFSLKLKSNQLCSVLYLCYKACTTYQFTDLDSSAGKKTPPQPIFEMIASSSTYSWNWADVRDIKRNFTYNFFGLHIGIKWILLENGERGKGRDYYENQFYRKYTISQFDRSAFQWPTIKLK